jgi:ppGpp synthetase/RelA/SpoT-type nucleotidyltranferase
MADIEDWLAAVLPVHGRLTNVVQFVLQNVLQYKGIEFLSVTGRTKDVISAREKIHRKQYKDPKTQLTDISGIRIVTFLEHQVEEISQVIKETFDIDESNSLDRGSILGLR